MYQDSQVAELSARIKSIRFAMFTTRDQHGHLTSHPMTSQDLDPPGAPARADPGGHGRIPM